MDTRNKIIDPASAARAAAGTSLTVVTGYFDPLTAAHARRLEEIAAGGAPLLVIVRTPPDPILEARARAELVAALSCVRYVTIEEGGADWSKQFSAARLIREEEDDLRRRRELIALVRRRHAAG